MARPFAAQMGPALSGGNDVTSVDSRAIGPQFGPLALYFLSLSVKITQLPIAPDPQYSISIFLPFCASSGTPKKKAKAACPSQAPLATRAFSLPFWPR